MWIGSMGDGLQRYRTAASTASRCPIRGRRLRLSVVPDGAGVLVGADREDLFYFDAGASGRRRSRPASKTLLAVITGKLSLMCNR